MTFLSGINLNRWLEKPLVGILAGGVAIRLVGVFTRGINYDDAFSILLASRPIPEIIRGTAADTMPPLYYLVLHFWQLAGLSIAFQRLPGFLFSIGIILTTYKIVRQIAGRTAAIWTAGILAVSPLQYYHAQDIRMYSMAAFFDLVWIWGAVQLIKFESPSKMPFWNWLILVASGTAALYSHALAGFGLLAPYVYLLFKRDWNRFGYLTGAGVLSGILFIPWLVYIPGQIAKVQHAFWTPSPGIVEIFQSLAMMLGDIPVPPFVLGYVLFCTISVAIFCLFVFFRSRENINKYGLFILMAIVQPILLFVLSYVMRPMFVPRGFLSAYIGLAACFGVAAAFARPIERVFIGGLILSAALISLPYSVTYNQFPRSPFRQASEYVENEITPGDVILHDNKLSSFPFEVYAPNLNSQFLPDKPGSANDTLAYQTQEALQLFPVKSLNEAINDSQKILFVVFQETIQEYEDAGFEHPVIEELESKFDQSEIKYFGDLLVIAYSNPRGTP